ELIRKYNPEIISIESNSIGEGIYQELIKRFPNINFNKFYTSANSKQAMIGSLQVWIESGKIELINDEIIKSEFLNFVRIGQQLCASNGHDDIVLSSAFALSGLIKLESEGEKPPFRIGSYSVS
ncbi:hypothetical protein, partial [Planktothrix sp.]|uniref:phage terminase large subunit family protein n=1 Tax=Planktothrix sp. TaxID=3088171 RepID=UPI0038D42FC5